MILSSRAANPDVLESKLSRFTVGNTRVVTDFDSTLTAENGSNSWSIFSDAALLPPEGLEERRALREKYYPIEIDHSLPFDVRAGHMRDWWVGALDILRRYGLKKDDLASVAAHKMVLREGFSEFLRETHGLSLPVLVLSAGITQSIESLLAHNGADRSNVSVASNRLTFDQSWICDGYEGNVIHITNKDEWDADESARSHFEERKHILLFGDSLDDIRMVSSEKRDDTVAVGFCTKNRKHQLDLFRETFDVVVEDDFSDGGVCAALVARILANGK